MDVNPLLPAGFDVAWSLVTVLLAGAQVFLLLAAARSILSSARLTRAGRLLWIVVVLVIPFLGAIAWFAGGRSAELDRDVG